MYYICIVLFVFIVMSVKSHTDNNAIRIDYRIHKAEGLIEDISYKQIKKLFKVTARTYHELLHLLDDYTLRHVQDINSRQGKIACIKRKHVRAVLLQNN